MSESLLGDAGVADLVIAAQVLCALRRVPSRESAQLANAFAARLAHTGAADVAPGIDGAVLRTARERLFGAAPVVRERDARLRWEFGSDSDRRRFLVLGEEIVLGAAPSAGAARRRVAAFVAAAPLMKRAWLWAVVTDPETLALFVRLLGCVCVAVPDDAAAELEPLGPPLALLAYDALDRGDAAHAAQLLFASLACAGSGAAPPLACALARGVRAADAGVCRHHALYAFGITHIVGAARSCARC